MSSIPPTALRRGVREGRGQTSGKQSKPTHTFDLVIPFSLLGVALVSTVALIGDMAYALPRSVSLILSVVPLAAIVLVGFAVFSRRIKHKDSPQRARGELK